MKHNILIGVTGLIVIAVFTYFIYDISIKPMYLASKDTASVERYDKPAEEKLTEEELIKQPITLTTSAYTNNFDWKKYSWIEKFVKVKGSLVSVTLYPLNQKCYGAVDGTYSNANPDECALLLLYRNIKSDKEILYGHNLKCEDFTDIGFSKDFDEYIDTQCKLFSRKSENESNWVNYEWNEEVIKKKDHLVYLVLTTKNKKCSDTSDYVYSNTVECSLKSVYRNLKTGQQFMLWRVATCKDFIDIGFDDDFDEYVSSLCKK